MLWKSINAQIAGMSWGFSTWNLSTLRIAMNKATLAVLFSQSHLCVVGLHYDGFVHPAQIYLNRNHSDVIGNHIQRSVGVVLTRFVISRNTAA